MSDSPGCPVTCYVRWSKVHGYLEKGSLNVRQRPKWWFWWKALATCCALSADRSGLISRNHTPRQGGSSSLKSRSQQKYCPLAGGGFRDAPWTSFYDKLWLKLLLEQRMKLGQNRDHRHGNISSNFFFLMILTLLLALEALLWAEIKFPSIMRS